VNFFSNLIFGTGLTTDYEEARNGNLTLLLATPSDFCCHMRDCQSGCTCRCFQCKRVRMKDKV